MELITKLNHLMIMMMMIIAGYLRKDCHGNPDAKRLYDDLLRRGGYNKLVRPVERYGDVLYVRLGLKLSQLIDVDEKNQVMATNVWLTQEWTDDNLKWSPAEYGEIDILYVPSDEIWLPEVVLFNNADGNYEVTLMTKASVRSDGRVLWEPPAVYKSSCTMDVEFFPFDEQICSLKFGSWTYDASQVEIIHMHQADIYVSDGKYLSKNETGSNDTNEMEVKDGMVVVHKGIDVADFYENVEWDLLAVPALKRIYSSEDCCHNSSDDDGGGGKNQMGIGDGGDGDDGDGDYRHVGNCSKRCRKKVCDRSQFRPEITFNITIRRKTLFHTVNLILPCVAISLLTVIVFHLPSDSGEKVALSISILLSLTVFFLLLAEIIPPTSLVVPLIGKFLLFTMLLVTFSIFVTVLVLNVHFRIPTLRLVEMGPRTKYIFLHILPQLLRVDVGKCFKKKKPLLMPYNISRCLDQDQTTVTRECISTYQLRSPDHVGVQSPTSVSYHTPRGKHNHHPHHHQQQQQQIQEESLHLNLKNNCGHQVRAKVISHHNNFVRRGQDWEGGILAKEEFRDALSDKLQQLVRERNIEAKVHVPIDSQRVRTTQRHVATTSPHGDPTRQNKTMSNSPEAHYFHLPQNIQTCVKRSAGKHPEILKAFEGVHIIADHLRREKEVKTIMEDWKFVAMMLDRVFFWLFTAACICGGVTILLQAPSIYDSRIPLTQSNT